MGTCNPNMPIDMSQSELSRYTDDIRAYYVNILAALNVSLNSGVSFLETFGHHSLHLLLEHLCLFLLCLHLLLLCLHLLLHQLYQWCDVRHRGVVDWESRNFCFYLLLLLWIFSCFNRADLRHFTLLCFLNDDQTGLITVRAVKGCRFI